MTEEMRSRVLGMILGRVSRGQPPKPTAEPVAFLYGPDKIRLPGLPELSADDKALYHCMLIYRNDEIYGLDFSEYAAVFDGENNTWGYAYTGYYLSYSRNEENTEWVYKGKYYTTTQFGNLYPWSTDIIWAKPSILRTDGSVYLPESDPIPVL
jgi:hypothetical protein